MKRSRAAALPEPYRGYVGQLQTGACLDSRFGYRDLRKTVPRHSHLKIGPAQVTIQHDSACIVES